MAGSSANAGVMDRVRRAVVPRLIRHDRLFATTRWLYRRARALYNQAYVRAWRGRSPHANHYIWTDPRTVTRKCRIASNKFRDTGKVLGGDWDRDTFGFDTEYPYYASIEAVVEGKPWEETPLYTSRLRGLRQGGTPGGVRSERELRDCGERILALYRDIRDNGYRRPEGDTFRLGASDEISVHIGRSGEILFHDGGHRLSIAKLLELDRVPAQVSLRHAQWDSFRRSLIQEAKHTHGRLYQRVPHPDLDVIPFSHDCSERMAIIGPHLDSCSGKLLDIGANWGMFCHRMEELGFDCVAVEMDPSHLRFLTRIRDTFGKTFAIEKGSILDLDPTRHGRFDVVLALNVFHHLIKTRTLHEKLTAFLKRLKTNCIFFQPHKKEEFASMNYYRNYDEQEFVAFVMEHTGLTRQERIGHADDGRAIYKLH